MTDAAADASDEVEIEVGVDDVDVDLDDVDVDLDDVDELDDGAVALDDLEADPVASARRMHGKGGAMVAAGMFGLEQAMGIKVKPDSVQVQEAPTDPIDLDKDGITVMLSDTTVATPALERRSPIGIGKKKRHR